jgi:hypothetical protein
LMAEEFGYDTNWVDEQLVSYRQLVKNYL